MAKLLREVKAPSTELRGKKEETTSLTELSGKKEELDINSATAQLKPSELPKVVITKLETRTKKEKVLQRPIPN